MQNLSLVGVVDGAGDIDHQRGNGGALASIMLKAAVQAGPLQQFHAQIGAALVFGAVLFWRSGGAG